ncbi:hypothetical protein [Cellulosimicrobium marinum]|uniref:hypothetical protein n=1 Tax=Cellulosimicrobium marinum TaxID=1638992 RepID=UPI001E315458|nr:hypothetical protein [Cellulosimicrobium marinum]MCB7137010.1 hypothetical protein [Cellulosimicrobium marinum]
MTASETVLPAPAGAALHAVRLAVFRVLCVVLALLLVVGFGAWRGLLAPWVVLPDTTDHGWDRTPELHRLADAAAGLFFVVVAAALVVLAVRPSRRSGLVAWAGGSVALSGAFSWVSALVQGHDVAPMVAFSAVWVAASAAVFVGLHPEGHQVLRGGAPADDAPGRALRGVTAALGVAGAVTAVVAVVWRLAGGTVESTAEDDVLSLVLLGLSWALGAWVVLRGRAGWRPLAALLLASGLYAGVAGLVLALSSSPLV